MQLRVALYHSLVESLPINIFRKDLSGCFTFANKLFCETLRKPPGDIIGKTDFDFFPKELAEKYRQDDQGIMQTRGVFELTWSGIKSPTERRPTCRS